MKIIETYGNYIEKWSNEDPDRARSEVPVCPGQKTDAGRPVSSKTYDGYDAYAFGKTTGKCNSQHLYSLRTVAGGRNPSV